jgi:hypothetical protein
VPVLVEDLPHGSLRNAYLAKKKSGFPVEPELTLSGRVLAKAHSPTRGRFSYSPGLKASRHAGVLANASQRLTI